ncbi:MAG: LPS export ABC transporter periplasmic protein LptC, partial [Algoriphagus sp.]
MNKIILSLVIGCIAILASSCREDVDASAMEAYEGPINMAVNIHLIRSGSAIVRSEIKAPKQLDFANGNQEFPEGIEIKIFETDAQLSTTMRADRGYL